MTRTRTHHDLEVPDRLTCYPGEIELDDGFRDLVPQSAEDQDGALFESLGVNGWEVPLVVWKWRGRLILLLLLLGYPAYEIVRNAGQPCRVVVKEFADRGAACRYVVQYMLTHHRMTRLALRYYRGLRYDDAKPPVGRSPRNDAASSSQGTGRGPDRRLSLGMRLSAAALAEVYHVDARTIERDAEFSRGVEKLARIGGAGTRRLLLSEKAGATVQGVVRLAKLEDEEKQKDILEALHLTGKLPRVSVAAGRRMVCLPREPEQLAAALLRRFDMVTLPLEPVAFARALRERVDEERYRAIAEAVLRERDKLDKLPRGLAD